MKRTYPLLLALTLTSLFHGKSWADPSATTDAIGSFLQSRQLGTSGEAIGARHKGSADFRLQTTPRLSLFGRPADPEAPSFDSQTLLMSDVVVTAMGYLGRPYVYGENSMHGGFDCSGFVLSLFQRSVGHTLPRTAAEQAHATAMIDKAELQPGDLVFFNTMRRQYSHVGVYIGEGRFIHSPRAGASIRVESMEVAYWKNRFNGARRVVTPEIVQMASAA